MEEESEREGGRGVKRAKKICGQHKETEKIEKLRMWRKTKWSSLGADIFPLSRTGERANGNT